MNMPSTSSSPDVEASMKSGMLEKIEVKGYKSIKHLDLELQHLNILIGPNGAGKSNFISFFELVNHMLNKDLQLFVGKQGIDRLLHFGSKHTHELKMFMQFGPNRYQATLQPTEDREHLSFKEEFADFDADQIQYAGGYKRIDLAAAGATESALPEPGVSSIATHVARFMFDWKVYHFHDTSATAQLKNRCNIHDNSRLRPNAENLAAFLYSIKRTNPQSYQMIVNTVQRVAPFFQHFILEPEKLNEDYIRLRWKHTDNDDYFDAHSLSDGTLRFICLSTLLLQPDLPTVILLDEPELGLHPYAIQLLVGLIRSAAHRTQVIAATQSATLVDEFDYTDILVIEQVNGASKIRRLTDLMEEGLMTGGQMKDWLESYKLGELWQKNLIGGNPP